MSSAVYMMLHLVEVFLRNSIDTQLRAWNATQVNPQTGRPHNNDWLLDPSHLIERVVRRNEIDKATQRAKLAVRDSGTSLRPITHDEVLAQLMFGTWRFLLPGRDPGRQLLWQDAIRRAFPGLRRPVRELVRDVDRLHRLRNRVAHLGPLLVVPVVSLQLKAARRVLREIEPSAEMWLVSHQQVSTVAAQQPAPASEMPNGPLSEN